MTTQQEAIKGILKGIDQTESESNDGWWETSTGAEFGRRKLEETIAALDSIQPTPMPEAIKLAREAVKANHEWHQNYDDYGGYPDSELCEQNTTALAALDAVKEPEPFAWFYVVNDEWYFYSKDKPPEDAYDEGTLVPLYTATPINEAKG